MSPKPRRLVARLWRVDCPTHGRAPAQTRDYWINGRGDKIPYAEPDPVIAGSIPVQLGRCAVCLSPGRLMRLRAYERVGVPPEDCDERCLRAMGPGCYCVCRGTCHGLGACTGHSPSAKPEESARPSEPRRASDEPDDPEAEDALKDATRIMNRRHDPESPDPSVGADF